MDKLNSSTDHMESQTDQLSSQTDHLHMLILREFYMIANQNIFKGKLIIWVVKLIICMIT